MASGTTAVLAIMTEGSLAALPQPRYNTNEPIRKFD